MSSNTTPTTPTTTSTTPVAAPNAGTIITGKVRNPAAPDKAFVLVNLEGGIVGLLHESQLTGDRTARTERLKTFKKDDEVKVAVIKVEEKEGKTRVSLSEREVSNFEFASTLTRGVTLTGTVQKVTEFGAFVTLAEGVQGLLHVSEVTGDNPSVRDRALKLLKEGQQVTVQVKEVKFQEGRYRIGLSQRMAQRQQRLEQLTGGQVTKGTVVRVQDGTYLIALGCGLTGTLSADELGKSLGKGDNVRVKVSSVDGESITLTRRGVK